MRSMVSMVPLSLMTEVPAEDRQGSFLCARLFGEYGVVWGRE